MKPIWKSFFVALALGAAPLSPVILLQPAHAQAADPAVAQVQGFYDALTASMKAGGTAKSRYEKLKPAVEKAFDLPAMTAAAVGPAWATASEADKKALIEAFSKMTIANYAKNFDSYSGEKFTVEPASIVRGSEHFLAREDQRLTIITVELDRYKLLLAIPQHLHQVTEVFDRHAIHGLHNLKGRARIALRQLVRKER